MYERLHKGDTVALISISGGRAGDPDMRPRYELGKKRLEEIFGLKVVETPNALKGNDFIYSHPELRASDLLWAHENKEVKGIITNMGGDDSYRVLPYIDMDVIRENPKIFMGFSDIATWMAVYAYAGVRAYYGPSLLTPIAQPVALDEYTKQAIEKCLFSNEVIGEVYPSEQITQIEWNDHIKPKKIKWEKNTGYRILQGKGCVRGPLFAGCCGPLNQILGTKFFPKADFFKGSIIAVENGSPYGSALAGMHQWRALAATGMFDEAVGLIVPKLNDNEISLLKKVINEEVHREDLVILENVDFCHRTPMTILPIGAMSEIDCENVKFNILESGVK